MGYLGESVPIAFNIAVGAMYFGGGFGDLVLVVVYPSEALVSHEFSIKVGAKLTGKSA